MLEIKGKYTDAIVYAETIEKEAIDQIKKICDQKFMLGSNVRVMSDVHAGVGCVIGFTATLTDRVAPRLVGVDIGCGVLTAQLDNTEIDLEMIDKAIRESIPYGIDIRDKPLDGFYEVGVDKLRCLNSINMHRVSCSFGKIGGGNHYCEIGKDTSGNLYIQIHSGSGYLGQQVGKHYIKLAKANLEKLSPEAKLKLEEDKREIIATYKEQGRQDEIGKELVRIINELKVDVPNDLIYVEGRDFNDYLHDMKIAQEYAKLNRVAVLNEIVSKYNTLGRDKLLVGDSWDTIHNYIDTDDMIMRKGAISAKLGEKVTIPMNMRDGSLVGVGKGNLDWNCSAPHGAGRLYSRTQASKKFSLEEYKKSMEGIYTTSVCNETVDECPMTYKPMEEIARLVVDTVDIANRIVPIYNYKEAEVKIDWAEIKRKQKENRDSNN